MNLTFEVRVRSFRAMSSLRNATPASMVLAAVMCAINLAGCGKSEAPISSSTVSVGGPQISAAPNPVPAGSEKFGKTTISWNTGDGSVGDVYVSTGGAPEKLFAGKRPKGSLEAAWIGKGEYEFRLYAGTDHKKVLATVIVTRLKE